MLLDILLVILVFVCVALTGVILLQRSEGGALGVGGGPAGMFTARGAGDLLTRTTSILAAAFFILSLTITLLSGHSRANSSVTDQLKVNPIDLSALAKAAASSAPASAQGEAAPPLPTVAPPLPTQAPRPTLQAAPRPTRSAANQAAQPIVLPNIAVRPSSQFPLPKPNLNAPAPPADQPAPASKP